LNKDENNLNFFLVNNKYYNNLFNELV
jgi:hypothetical protein